MAEKPQLFGTDGVRGIAGKFPLDPVTVWKLGCALGEVLQEDESSHRSSSQPPQVVLGRDTRESGNWIAATVVDGLRAAGVQASDVGVITTPGLAFLARGAEFAAGVMISASHNPYRDNGIKVLSRSGTKLPEAVELRIERRLDSIVTPPRTENGPPMNLRPELATSYLQYLSTMASDLKGAQGLRLVMDCANGAASFLGPQLAAALSIETAVLSAAPDGRNINLHSGSLHPQTMARVTAESGADLGVAFDGDADRAIFATRSGRIADGDHVLYAISQFLQDRGRLQVAAVVGTQMTNFALESELEKRGIALRRTPVGDRYVLEEMVQSGINLGGEPSGHTIFADRSLAGDGLVTLLEMLKMIVESGRGLEEWVSDYRPMPQLIVNVPVRAKPALETIPEVAAAIATARHQIDHGGRVVVRYSGTEALARVMVEARDDVLVQTLARGIADVIESEIGARSGLAHSKRLAQA